jgi:hypothetical protein
MESNRRLAFKKIGAGLATIFGFSVSAKAAGNASLSTKKEVVGEIITDEQGICKTWKSPIYSRERGSF